MVEVVTPTPSPNGRREDLRGLLEFEGFARVCVHILDKNGKLRGLRLNPVQKLGRAKAGRKNIWLKARQMGISTMLQAEGYFDVTTRPGFRMVTVSHEKEATRKLLQKLGVMLDNHPTPRPKASTENSSEIAFRALNSTTYIGTAGARAFGRGDTVHRLHASEFAFWPKPNEILTGATQAVPMNGRIDIESTANGFNEFYTLWNEAVEGRNGYTPIFLPWFLDPSYAIAPGVPVEEWDKEEQAAAVNALRYGVVLSAEQMAFRRLKRRELKREFAQEYPEDPVTCFLTSGRPRFDNEVLARLLAVAPEPKKTREIANTLLTLKIWEEPRADGFYVIGADAAQGLSAGDNDAADVLDWHTGKTVATLHGKAEPFAYTAALCALGKQYNNAVLAIERKETGIAVVQKAVELGYPNLFHMRDEKGMKVEQPGVDTNVKWRPQIVDAIGEWLADSPDSFVDNGLIGELMQFVIKASGKAEAEQGAHDDRVMAGGIARFVHGMVKPPMVRERREYQRTVGRQL